MAFNPVGDRGPDRTRILQILQNQQGEGQRIGFSAAPPQPVADLKTTLGLPDLETKENRKSPGGLFGAVLQGLDFGRAAIVSTLKEGIDLAQGEGFDTSEWWDQATTHYGFGELIHDERSAVGWGLIALSPFTASISAGLGAAVLADNIWADRIVGFIGDVAVDPWTHMGGFGVVMRGLGWAGAAKALNQVATKSADDLVRMGFAQSGDEAAALIKAANDGISAAQKGRSLSAVSRSLSKSEAGKKVAAELGLAPGLRMRLPGTGPVGRFARQDRYLDRLIPGLDISKRRARQIPKFFDEAIREAGVDPVEAVRMFRAGKGARAASTELSKQLDADLVQVLGRAARAPVEFVLPTPFRRVGQAGLGANLINRVADAPVRGARKITPKAMREQLGAMFNPQNFNSLMDSLNPRHFIMGLNANDALRFGRGKEAAFVREVNNAAEAVTRRAVSAKIADDSVTALLENPELIVRDADGAFPVGPYRGPEQLRLSGEWFDDLPDDVRRLAREDPEALFYLARETHRWAEIATRHASEAYGVLDDATGEYVWQAAKQVEADEGVGWAGARRMVPDARRRIHGTFGPEGRVRTMVRNEAGVEVPINPDMYDPRLKVGGHKSGMPWEATGRFEPHSLRNRLYKPGSYVVIGDASGNLGGVVPMDMGERGIVNVLTEADGKTPFVIRRVGTGGGETVKSVRRQIDEAYARSFGGPMFESGFSVMSDAWKTGMGRDIRVEYFLKRLRDAYPAEKFDDVFGDIEQALDQFDLVERAARQKGKKLEGIRSKAHRARSRAAFHAAQVESRTERIHAQGGLSQKAVRARDEVTRIDDLIDGQRIELTEMYTRLREHNIKISELDDLANNVGEVTKNQLAGVEEAVKEAHAMAARIAQIQSARANLLALRDAHEAVIRSELGDVQQPLVDALEDAAQQAQAARSVFDKNLKAYRSLVADLERLDGEIAERAPRLETAFHEAEAALKDASEAAEVARVRGVSEVQVAEDPAVLSAADELASAESGLAGALERISDWESKVDEALLAAEDAKAKLLDHPAGKDLKSTKTAEALRKQFRGSVDKSGRTRRKGELRVLREKIENVLKQIERQKIEKFIPAEKLAARRSELAEATKAWERRIQEVREQLRLDDPRYAAAQARIDSLNDEIDSINAVEKALGKQVREAEEYGERIGYAKRVGERNKRDRLNAEIRRLEQSIGDRELLEPTPRRVANLERDRAKVAAMKEELSGIPKSVDELNAAISAHRKATRKQIKEAEKGIAEAKKNRPTISKSDARAWLMRRGAGADLRYGELPPSELPPTLRLTKAEAAKANRYAQRLWQSLRGFEAQMEEIDQTLRVLDDFIDAQDKWSEAVDKMNDLLAAEVRMNAVVATRRGELETATMQARQHGRRVRIVGENLPNLPSEAHLLAVSADGSEGLIRTEIGPSGLRAPAGRRVEEFEVIRDPLPGVRPSKRPVGFSREVADPPNLLERQEGRSVVLRVRRAAAEAPGKPQRRTRQDLTDAVGGPPLERWEYTALRSDLSDPRLTEEITGFATGTRSRLRKAGWHFYDENTPIPKNQRATLLADEHSRLNQARRILEDEQRELSNLEIDKEEALEVVRRIKAGDAFDPESGRWVQRKLYHKRPTRRKATEHRPEETDEELARRVQESDIKFGKKREKYRQKWGHLFTDPSYGPRHAIMDERARLVLSEIDDRIATQQRIIDGERLRVEAAEARLRRAELALAPPIERAERLDAVAREAMERWERLAAEQDFDETVVSGWRASLEGEPTAPVNIYSDLDELSEAFGLQLYGMDAVLDEAQAAVRSVAEGAKRLYGKHPSVRAMRDLISRMRHGLPGTGALTPTGRYRAWLKQLDQFEEANQILQHEAFVAGADGLSYREGRFVPGAARSPDSGLVRIERRIADLNRQIEEFAAEAGLDTSRINEAGYLRSDLTPLGIREGESLFGELRAVQEVVAEGQRLGAQQADALRKRAIADDALRRALEANEASLISRQRRLRDALDLEMQARDYEMGEFATYMDDTRAALAPITEAQRRVEDVIESLAERRARLGLDPGVEPTLGDRKLSEVLRARVDLGGYEPDAFSPDSLFSLRAAERETAAELLKDAMSKSQWSPWRLASGDELLDAEMASIIHAFARINDRADAGKFWGAWDKFQTWLKASMIATPGFVARNVFGAFFNAWIDGVNLNEIARAGTITLRVAREMNRAQVPFLEAAERLAAQDEGIRDYVELLRLGVRGGGQAVSSVEVEWGLRNARSLEILFGGRMVKGGAQTSISLKPWSPRFVGFQTIRSLNSWVEDIVRLGIGMDTMRWGGTADDALARIAKTQFDYDELTSWERDWAKRFIPFYTWTRKNLPYQLKQLGMHPGKYNRLLAAKRNLELGTDDEGVVPDYYMEPFGIRLPFSFRGATVYTAPDIPFQDLGRYFGEGGVKGAAQSLLSGASPIVKTPLEVAFGKQVFTGIPFTGRYQQAPNPITKIAPVMHALSAMGWAKKNKLGEWRMRDHHIYLVNGMLPSVGLIRRLFPNEEKYQRNQIRNLLSVLGGVSVNFNTPQVQANWLKTQRYERMDDRQDLKDLVLRTK